MENITPSFWKKRRVLITGGSGFVGYYLASTLAKLGAEVLVLDRKPLPRFGVLDTNYRHRIRFTKGSITNQKLLDTLLKKKRPQTLFHLAAEAIVSRAEKNPARAFDTNIRGTWIVLESARKHGTVSEIVVASSDKAYGVHDTLPYTEASPLQGRFPYDTSKSCTDLVTQAYARTYELPVGIIRCGNIYGRGDMNGSRLIPDALYCLTKGKTFDVRSNGKFLRDYVHVEDAVCAYLLLAEHMQKKKLHGEAFNIAHNTPLTVLDVMTLLEKVSEGLFSSRILNIAKHEIPDQYLDAKKARRVLRWKPSISHQDGFKDTHTWYSNFFKNNGKLEK